MGTKFIAYKTAFTVLLLLMTPLAVRAENAPLSDFTLTARYTLSWSGITVGRLIITTVEDDSHYSFSLDTKTRGLGALMSDEKSIITAEGKKNAAGEYLASRFDSRPQKKLDDDIITLTYGEDGKIINRLRTKDDDPAWRPPVPFEQINTAHDPLTGVFMLRRLLHAALASNQQQISTRSYDGMRLADVQLIRLPDARVEVMDEYRDSVAVLVRRVPINGYTPKELKKYNKGDPEIRFYFSHDAAFIPIRATAETGFGDIAMTLEKIE